MTDISTCGGDSGIAASAAARPGEHYLQVVKHCDLIPRTGKVLQFYGLAVEASGPSVFLGELCHIYASSSAAPVLAEVVGFRDRRVIMMPYGDLQGISIGSEIIATGRRAAMRVGPQLVGRIIDAFGEPLDGRPLAGHITGHMAGQMEEYSLYPETTNPLQRETISAVFETGVKAIDSFLTVGKGQRIGLLAGSGVGKSSLLGMIARNSRADINVIALVGERGREVIDFVEAALGAEGLQKSVVIVATADQHALIRSHAAYAATAIAEYFKDRHKDVMLAMDSVTRFAMAQREIGLAVGEPPTARGYTPSAFSVLPKLLERAGNFAAKGSITAFYTVLVEGDDFNEPVADNLRAILDGHVVLSRALAARGHYPAIDILQSISRLANSLNDADTRRIAADAREVLSLYDQSKDMIEVGAYVQGQRPQLDRAISLVERVNEFLTQDVDARVERTAAIRELAAIVGGA